jgi:hypothetical protein
LTNVKDLQTIYIIFQRVDILKEHQIAATI